MDVPPAFSPAGGTSPSAGIYAPMTSIDDVARETGLSTASVSRAMRGLPGVSAANRVRIADAARRLGYVPSPNAAGLASRRTRLVAVIVPRLTHEHVVQAVQGAQEVLSEADYGVLLYSLAGGPAVRQRLFGTGLLSSRADAVLIVGFRLTPREYSHLAERDRPVVLVGASTTVAQQAWLQGQRGAAHALAQLEG